MPLDATDPRIREKLARLEQLKAAAAHRQQLDETNERRYLQRCRTDIRYFMERVIEDEKAHKPIVLADVHKAWIDHSWYCWSRGLIAGILAPWGHGKTSFIEAVPLFLFGTDPTLRIKIVSVSLGVAKKRLAKVRDYIMNSEPYHELFPNVKQHDELPWTTTELFLKRPTRARDASLEACGIDSTGIGSRADVLLFDDVNDQTNTINEPLQRPKVFENYMTTYIRGMEDDSRAIYVATRWHEEDIYGLINADVDMRQGYGWLVQRIYDDCRGIECSYFYPDEVGPAPESRLSHIFAKAA